MTTCVRADGESCPTNRNEDLCVGLYVSVSDGMGTTAACRAVFGKGLGADLRGVGGRMSIGGKKANLTGNVLAYATEIGERCVPSAVLERQLLRN